LTRAIERAADGGSPLLDAILEDVRRELGGQPQEDDQTLVTVTVLEH
jgi:serine phosphatase RsbU (regulator of sigma subunit)